jgi:hypothetical protein
MKHFCFRSSISSKSYYKKYVYASASKFFSINANFLLPELDIVAQTIAFSPLAYFFLYYIYFSENLYPVGHFK